MATLYNFNSPPIKGAAWTFYISLISQADTDIFKTSPTLAAGDITVSIDGGNFANIGTLPTQIQSTGVLPVALTTAEMNGNIIIVKFVDAADAEWQDALVVIYTVSAVTPDVNTASISANAITASALNTDAVNEIVDQTWNELTADHATAATTGKAVADAASAGGATPASLWAYTTRTLTQSAATVTSVVSGTKLTITRGDSLSAAFTGLGATTGYTSIWFTIKYDKSDTDAQSIIQIKKNTSGSGDGLLYVNGAAAANAALGSITIVDAATGALTVALDESITDDLPIMEGLYYDFQYLVSGTVTTKTESICDIVGDVTRSIT